MSTFAINIDNLSKEFYSDRLIFRVLDNVSINISKGEFVAVLGPSGCGKTTLLRMIAGLEEPTSGSINIAEDIRRIGMVFQEYTAFDWLTVERNIYFGLKLAGAIKSEHRNIVDYWLEKTGLTEFRNHFPSQLSGGMRQRLAFARTLATKPGLVLLDEPFGSLDLITREKMADFALKLLSEQDITTILVTHSILEAVRIATRTIVLSSRPGHIVLDRIKDKTIISIKENEKRSIDSNEISALEEALSLSGNN